jgi:hypothetical protein
MHLSLRAVTGRFPQLRERTECLFETDENFRDLCDEYETCSKTVARLTASAPASERMRDEYAALLLRLEGELLHYLEKDPNG